MRIRALSVFAVAGVFVLAACAAPPPPPPTSGTTDDEVALRGLGAKYSEAWTKGDVPTLVSMVTDDYEAVAADGTTIKGKASFEEMEKKAAAERAALSLKLTVQTTYVQWAGSANAAALGGTWTLEGLPPGMGSGKGAWTGLAKKGADGQWRLSTGLVADYVPPPAPPAPAQGKG
jgi:ketosteroid isomerase-like protein